MAGLSAAQDMGLLAHISRICFPVWSGIAAVVLLPLAGSAKEEGPDKPLVWINIATRCGTIVIPPGFYILAGAVASLGLDTEWHVMSP